MAPPCMDVQFLYKLFCIFISKELKNEKEPVKSSY